MTDPPTRSSVRADTEPTPTSATASTVIPPPSFWTRGWVGLAVQYPRGWWRLVLHSRFAAWLPFVVTGLGYAYAAAPDFGVEALRGPAGLAGLLALWLLSSWVTQVVVGAELVTYQQAFQSVADLVVVFAGDESADPSGRVFADPATAIGLLLRRAKELSAASLRPPAGCVITAHLLIPEHGSPKRGRPRVLGLRVLHHDDFRPHRRHALITLDCPGAGDAFMTAEAAALPDTADSVNPRVRGRPYRSIAAFPVVVEEGERRKVRAVLTLDATTPYLFTPRSVASLTPFMRPIVQLLGVALAISDRRSGNDA